MHRITSTNFSLVSAHTPGREGSPSANLLAEILSVYLFAPIDCLKRWPKLSFLVRSFRKDCEFSTAFRCRSHCRSFGSRSPAFLSSMDPVSTSAKKHRTTHLICPSLLQRSEEGRNYDVGRCRNLVASKSVANQVISDCALEEGTLKLADHRLSAHLMLPAFHAPSPQDLSPGHSCQVWGGAAKVLCGAWKRHNYGQMRVRAALNMKPDPALRHPLSSASSASMSSRARALRQRGSPSGPPAAPRLVWTSYYGFNLTLRLKNKAK